jgi:hypothetical protein
MVRIERREREVDSDSGNRRYYFPRSCAWFRSSSLLGDDTAWCLGRVSFNPVKHIDPFGTILLPGMLLLLHAPFLLAMPSPCRSIFGRFGRRDGTWCWWLPPDRHHWQTIAGMFDGEIEEQCRTFFTYQFQQGYRNSSHFGVRHYSSPYLEKMSKGTRVRRLPSRSRSEVHCARPTGSLSISPTSRARPAALGIRRRSCGCASALPLELFICSAVCWATLVAAWRAGETSAIKKTVPG